MKDHPLTACQMLLSIYRVVLATELVQCKLCVSESVCGLQWTV